MVEIKVLFLKGEPKKKYTDPEPEIISVTIRGDSDTVLKLLAAVREKAKAEGLRE
jgi:hypothetical protein